MHAKVADGFGRRQFLAFGSASLAFAVLPVKMAWAEDAGQVVQVGYWSGSESLSALDVSQLAETNPIVPAESLATGDASLATSDALLRIIGLVPAAAAGGSLDQIALRVGFGGSPGAEAHGWSLVQRGGTPNVSGPVRMRVPVAGTGGLRLSGEVVPARTDPKKAIAFSQFLTLGAEEGLPKLRRGLYVLEFVKWMGSGEGLVFSVDRMTAPPPVPQPPAPQEASTLD